MRKIIYQDEYVTKYEGSDGYIFTEKCKNCDTEMDEIHSDGANCNGFDCIYWCPNCGTILRWYDCHKIGEDDWDIPLLNK
jgi:hypothetical protein